MFVAIVKNNAVTKHGRHKKLFPNVSFPKHGPSDEWLQANSVKKVIEYKALPNNNTKLVTVDPYLDVDGNVYSVQIHSLSESEITQNQNQVESDQRTMRDHLLDVSDWTQMPDSPLSSSKKTEWATYRQTLRDLPSDSNWPDVSFPDKPS